MIWPSYGIEEVIGSIPLCSTMLRSASYARRSRSSDTDGSMPEGLSGVARRAKTEAQRAKRGTGTTVGVDADIDRIFTRFIRRMADQTPHELCRQIREGRFAPNLLLRSEFNQFVNLVRP